jgi:small-conductance mechanosensitive channel
MPHRRTDLALGVDYNTHIPSAISTLLKTMIGVEGVLANPAPEVDAVGFGDSAVELMVRYWTLPQIMQVRQTKTRVIIALKEACEQAKISIPYPIRTLYHYDQHQDGDRPKSASTDSVEH